ncbi:MAG: DUF5683 domain-containing protein [Chitinophagaceae bacterium]
MAKKHFIICVLFLACGFFLKAQNVDSVVVSADTTIIKNQDTLSLKEQNKIAFLEKHEPRKATLRSAILPGWGQAYNKEYWKIPIVYGALAIPAATYLYNNKWYKKTRDAYNIVVNNDTAMFGTIDPKLQPLISNPTSLQFYRNQFRKDRDYSTLWFIILWGLNVADATVFAHLKHFDVSDNLSMDIRPDFNPQLKTAGIGIVFNFKNTLTK